MLLVIRELHVDCSSIKRLRELGSNRRETGWSLSGVGAKESEEGRS